MNNTIYIPQRKEKTWEEIKQAAAEQECGVGAYVCLLWEREQARGEKG